MKKILSLILVLALCLSLTVIFTGCDDRADYLRYGKKYTYISDSEDEDSKFNYRITFVFNKDQTGSYDYYYSVEDYKYAGEHSKKSSCVIDFEWRWADEERTAICVFETSRTYRDEHTNKNTTISITDYPFTIGEEFIFDVVGKRRYVLEDSDVFSVENDLSLNEQKKEQ